MDIINESLSNLNPALMLWIAGIVAGIFIILVAFDSVRRSRQRKRLERGYRSTKPPVGRLAQFRENYRAIKEEAKKRQRHSTHMRKINKSRK